MERIAFVGADTYTSYVAGNRHINAQSQDAVCGKGRVIRIERFSPPNEEDPPPESTKEVEETGTGYLANSAPDSTGPVKPGPPTALDGPVVLPEPDEPPDPHADVKWGHDKLNVTGNAEIRFHKRTFMARGKVDRYWNGGVLRRAPFEGVICGGGFMRVASGPTVAVSGLGLSDVYGGAGRVSGVRMLMAGLHYRDSEVAMWNFLLHLRAVAFTFDTKLGILNPTVMKVPKCKLLQKLAKIAAAVARVARVVSWFVAPFAIACAFLLVLSFPFLLLLQRYGMKTVPVPVPRTRIALREVGSSIESSQQST